VLRNDHHVRLGQALQPRREVWRLATTACSEPHRPIRSPTTRPLSQSDTGCNEACVLSRLRASAPPRPHCPSASSSWACGSEVTRTPSPCISRRTHRSGAQSPDAFLIREMTSRRSSGPSAERAVDRPRSLNMTVTDGARRSTQRAAGAGRDRGALFSMVSEIGKSHATACGDGRATQYQSFRGLIGQIT